MLEKIRRRLRQAKRINKTWKNVRKVWRRRDVFAGLPELCRDLGRDLHRRLRR